MTKKLRTSKGYGQRSTLATLGLASLSSLFLLASTTAHAAAAHTEVKLRPVAPSPEQVGTIGGPGALGLTLGIQSLLPFSNPFKSSDITPPVNFRYQMDTGYDLEFTLGLSDSLEVGGMIGYASYGARSAYSDTQFETITLRQWPVEGIVRYRQPVPGWAAEAEAGLGMGFGKFRAVSTNVNYGGIDESITALRGHVAVGVGYPWSDYVSIHLRTGYGFEGVGSKDFEDAKTLLKITRSNFSGLFLKGGLRANF